MWLVRMALRNLLRQWSRNAISMVAIVLGIYVIVFGRAFVNGLDENMSRAQIDAVSGHAHVLPAEDYPVSGLRHPVDQAYALSAEDQAWLDANTEAWTTRVVAAPRMIHGRDAMRVRLIGYDPTTDEAVFPRASWTVEGDMPESNPEGALVATGVMKLLELEPGDAFVLETRTVDGALNAMRFVATGTLKSGNPLLDNVGVMVPLERVDQLVAGAGRITHVSTRLANRRDSDAFAEAATAQIGGTTHARTWLEEVKPLMEAQSTRRTMFNIMGLAMFGMAAAGIANTILMAAFERVREVGTLRSMGMQRSGVLAMFGLEGLGLGIVGGLLGALLSGAGTYYYSQVGLDMATLMAGREDQTANLPMSLMLYLEFSPATLLASVVVAVVVSVAASLYPAWLASRELPADAVRAA